MAHVLSVHPGYELGLGEGGTRRSIVECSQCRSPAFRVDDSSLVAGMLLSRGRVGVLRGRPSKQDSQPRTPGRLCMVTQFDPKERDKGCFDRGALLVAAEFGHDTQANSKLY